MARRKPVNARAQQSDVCAGLRPSTDDGPGWRRLRRSGGFRYVDSHGRAITSARALRRVRALAIPPAYEDVWICPDPRGHVQATARDARGRKQYRYHPDWRALRDREKFAHLRVLGRCLPALRRRLRRDLRRSQLDRKRVLAAAVMLLDLTGLRVGDDEYLRTNGSHGLTTLRDRHLKAAPAQLCFRGKGGVALRLPIDHARLLGTLRACRRLPGDALLQYVEDGTLRRLKAGDVNAHLAEITDQCITTKVFRTWKATVRLLEILQREAPAVGRDRRRLNEAIAQVAAELGNTPAVCRRAYIDPAVIDAWRSGRLADLEPAAAAGLRLSERSYLALASAAR